MQADFVGIQFRLIWLFWFIKSELKFRPQQCRLL